MRNHSSRNIDLKVQFWIDLIQVRAPGSSIIVVGTHMDSLSPLKVQDILLQLTTQLQRNENNRIDRVAQDISKLEEKLLSHSNKTDSSELLSKLDNLKSALNLRPKIRHCVSVCTCLSSSNPECSAESYDISELVDAIVSVSTITKDVQNPFQLVNVLHPMYYESVRKVISELKNMDYMMVLDDLHRIIQSRAAKGGTATKQSTEAAVAFLASIGEVSDKYAFLLYTQYLLLIRCYFYEGNLVPGLIALDYENRLSPDPIIDLDGYQRGIRRVFR
jgi:hypothetical protein